MKFLLMILTATAAALWTAPPAAAAAAHTCQTETPVIGVPTKGGPAYGGMQYPRMVGLGPKEVALTFDDGPDPKTTRRILDILDRHCVKATFFMVGIYAERHPEIVREVAARGHTIGTHTWSHPNNLRPFSATQAQREIRRGFAAVEAALSRAPEEDRNRLAPFFRFPGLNDSKSLIEWLGQRNVATFSCEFGADDWKSISSAQVRIRAIRNIASVGRGILILHDTKPRTAEMLSDFIMAMRQQGYSFVQMVPEPGGREMAAGAQDPLIGPVRRADAASVLLGTIIEPSLEPPAPLR
ncbi:polysaccharide deacetylase family protein [Parvibaculum lavamentivorans]|uniref:polysaccharide deacetylase family protein n=1 Tax=Parvibaculum lavamentivorans TaxID=256618 RepID=UPI0000ED4BDF|nr:polysaccharide deacetylase family protein [Parvibaculum lavamentivorans]